MPDKAVMPATLSGSVSYSSNSSCVTSPTLLGNCAAHSRSLTTSSSVPTNESGGGGDEGTTTPLVWRSDLSTAPTSYSDALCGRDDALQLMERHVELMTLLFQHIATCPPHGPFRFYSAMTFLQRARCYFGHDDMNAHSDNDLTKITANINGAQHANDDDTCRRSNTNTNSISESRIPGVVPLSTDKTSFDEAAMSGGTKMCHDDVLHGVSPYCASPAHLLAALTMPNILALMERYYNTRHLCAWPLLYVPAEIHLDDVVELERQQNRVSE